MDPTQGNPSAASGNETGALTDIMASMTAQETPAATTADNGTKANGNSEASHEDNANPAAPAWTSQLPEDIRNNPESMKQLSKFGKIGDLAKSYSELESKLGKSIVKPEDDDSDEVKAAFWSKLGKPADVTGYTGIDGENAEAIKQLAYQNNLSVEQATGIFNGFKEIANNALMAQQQAMEAQIQATDRAMRQEYGNDYATKLEMLKRGVQAYGGEELGAKLKASGLLYDPSIVKMFITLGEMNSEAGTYNKGTAHPKAYKSTAEGGSFEFKGL